MFGFVCSLVCGSPAQAASPPPVPAISVSASGQCKDDQKFMMDAAWIDIPRIAVNGHEVRVTVSIGKFVGDLRFPDSGQAKPLRSGAFFMQYDSDPKIVTDLVPQSSKPFTVIFLDVPSGEHKIALGLIGGNKMSGEAYEVRCVNVP
jgi:hypothetical protein